MRKSFVGSTLAVVLATILFAGFAPNVSADDGNRSDHALYFDGSTPADTAIYCGVAEHGKSSKAYTLHISGTASGGQAGSFAINFLDGDAMGFLVPADSTVSTTQALGGGPRGRHDRQNYSHGRCPQYDGECTSRGRSEGPIRWR